MYYIMYECIVHDYINSFIQQEIGISGSCNLDGCFEFHTTLSAADQFIVFGHKHI